MFDLPTGEGHVVAEFFMLFVYGYILFSASKIISDGSEMLLAIYGPGIVGGLLIPILGAVPDAAIILVSGMGGGTKEEQQASLAVGVGTLAGSTIMLLTLPWAASVFLGRRDLDPATGEAATYVDSRGVTRPKLTKFSWTENVVTSNASVPVFAKIMMATAISYLVIQIPAFFFSHDKDPVSEEKPYSLAGLVVTAVCLLAYSGYQLVDARNDALVAALQKEADRKRWKESLAQKFSNVSAFSKIFHAFDKDKSGHLERLELTEAIRSLGLDADREQIAHFIKMMDKDNDGRISEGEFTSVIALWMQEHSRNQVAAFRGSSDGLNRASSAVAMEAAAAGGGGRSGSVPSRPENASQPLLLEHAGSPGAINASAEPNSEADFAEGDEEEEEEGEEEFLELTDSQLVRRAYMLLLYGTALVTIFSDPMVDVISAVGNSLHIKPFFVSFLITPVASNASEVMSALIFAKRKTNRATALTFSTLYGAATMNNTLGLCIFMALVHFKGLEWDYSAEVISILAVTFVVGINGLRQTVALWQAAVVGLMFPLSLGIVVALEAAGLK